MIHVVTVVLLLHVMKTSWNILHLSLHHGLAIASIYRVERGMVGLLYHLTPHDSSLALHHLDLLQLLTFWRALVIIVHWIVSLAPVTFQANFVLLAHTPIPVLLVNVLVLHELPPLNITLHLG